MEFIVGGPGSSQLSRWFEARDRAGRAHKQLKELSVWIGDAPEEVLRLRREAEAEISATEATIAAMQPVIDRLNLFYRTGGLAGIRRELEDWSENVRHMKMKIGPYGSPPMANVRFMHESDATLFRLTFGDRWDITVADAGDAETVLPS